MDRRIKIMVSSAVYGLEDELRQVSATLRSYGYYVINSLIGTVRVHPNLSNLDNCLRAVEECDLFVGIIRPFMGTGYVRTTKTTPEENTMSILNNITFEEIKRAIELNKPCWFMVHRDVDYAYQLFKRIRNSETILEENKKQLKENRFFDPLCIDVYKHVLNNRVGSRWVQPYREKSEILEFFNAQFEDRDFIIENILTQED
jgi:hypothetical protein